MAIGHIKSVRVVDGQYELVITTGSGPAITATLLFPPGIDAKPLPGDAVRFSRNGQEIVVTGVFTEDVQAGDGEAILFARSSDGEISGSVRMKKGGMIEIVPGDGKRCDVGIGSDFVALAAKVDLLWSTIDALFRTGWTPVAQDGGAALKTAWTTVSFPTPPASVASTNLKAD